MLLLFVYSCLAFAPRPLLWNGRISVDFSEFGIKSRLLYKMQIARDSGVLQILVNAKAHDSGPETECLGRISMCSSKSTGQRATSRNCGNVSYILSLIHEKLVWVVIYRLNTVVLLLKYFSHFIFLVHTPSPLSKSYFIFFLSITLLVLLLSKTVEFSSFSLHNTFISTYGLT